MKLFSGFPTGKVSVTPLPNLFFSELCPAIDDLAELKVSLHIFWLIANRPARAPRSIALSELAADTTLMQSLAATDGKPEASLSRALAAASERGTLLHHSTGSGDDVYFLNDETGRRALEKIQQAQDIHPVSSGAAREPARADVRPNIFVLYEQNIGLLTPMISEELKEAEKEYPAEWIADAFKVAVKQNKRSWAYVNGILKRMKTEGRGDRSGKGKTWYGDEQSEFIKR
jgi:DnaD/phage-associated family protein